MTSIEYYIVSQVNGELELEDISNCAILANDDNGEAWVIITMTAMGITELITYGPFLLDNINGIYTDKVNYNYERFEYDQSKTRIKISKYINDYKKKITQAKEISYFEAKSYIKNIIDYLNVPDKE